METSDDKAEEIQSILLVIKESNDEKAVMQALDILLKLIKNILKSPQEEKFRKIKKTNKSIASKLLAVDGISELILALGFESISDEFYDFDINNYSELIRTRRIVEDEHDEIRKKYMTPEELEKFILLQDQKKQMIEEQRKKNKIKSELESGMKLDRVEKSKEEVKASKGNSLVFGANVVKFEPPAQPRGR